MKPAEQIEQLFHQWKRMALLRYALYGVAVALPIVALVEVFLAPGVLVLFLVGSTALCLFGGLFAWRDAWFRAAPIDLAFFLNRQYPELQDSAELLLTPMDQLTGLTRLQRQRIGQRLEKLELHLPQRLTNGLLAVGISAILSVGLVKIDDLQDSRTPFASELSSTGSPDTKETSLTTLSPPELLSLSVLIKPPAYTRKKRSTSGTPDIEAPVGSGISWTLRFSESFAEGRLSTGDGRDLPLRKRDDGSFGVALQLSSTTFYTLKFRAKAGEWISSDFFRLQAIPDEAPRVEVEGLPQYAEYPFDKGKQVRFETRVSDDYGVQNARIIATVSSGEGESVKFRDDTLYFDESFKRQARTYTLSKTIRLRDLGMDRGDELYLHIEALDNRRPVAQISKTFKYIIAFENPEAITMDMAGGLAVNRLPEYFRSQRQIIIDTERLIAREKQLNDKTFQEESNNIAIDQKLLRLRYGRFLGEEFQSVIGDIPSEGDEEEEGDHNHEEEGGEHAGHDHESDVQEELESEDAEIAMLEPYFHAHDITEEVTFFDATTTAKLRVALGEMWDAELHLRLGKPKKALPYEYKALKLIKEIQQASRIYVERVGFEPPAINVLEKRLSGELDAIRNPRVNRIEKEDNPYPAIEKAAPVLELLQLEQRSPAPEEYQLLQAAGEELAVLAIEQPGAYLNALQQLRSLMENELSAPRRREYLQELQRIFWSLLPDKAAQPVKAKATTGTLRSQYLEEIQNGNE